MKSLTVLNWIKKRNFCQSYSNTEYKLKAEYYDSKWIDISTTKISISIEILDNNILYKCAKYQIDVILPNGDKLKKSN